MISSLEQRKEPWMVKRKLTRGRCPDLKTVPETELPAKRDISKEKLPQAVIMERLTNYSLECSILGENWDYGALFERQPPDLVSLLEQGKEPWVVERELTRGLFSGQQSINETQELFPKQDSFAEVTDRTSNTNLECSTFRENWGSEGMFERK
ncbi:hypothetical protein GH733_017328, partial [Mirounga leonina]